MNNTIKFFLLLSLLTIISVLNTAHAGLRDASWYLSVDIDQLTTNPLIKALKGEDVAQHIPQEIATVTLYGDPKGAENATAVVSGDFRQFSLVEHFIDVVKSRHDEEHQIVHSIDQYRGHTIDVLTVKDDQQQVAKQGYVAKLNDQFTIVALNRNEINKWLDNDYDVSELNQGSLFSVVVNVETALAHMGMNLDDNSHVMHSQIFKKVSQISASLTDMNNNMVMEVGLSAKDEASAGLIQQVINGLIAMNNLSNINDRHELHALLMQNLNIEKNGKHIMLSTYVSIDDLQQMDVYKHLSHGQKDGFEGHSLSFD